MIKPIILVKIYYKLLYMSLRELKIFYKITSWPQLISQILVAHR